MWFTLFMFIGPLVLANLDGKSDRVTSIDLLAGFWIWASIPLVGAYWIARVVRMAWRHGAKPADS